MLSTRYPPFLFTLKTSFEHRIFFQLNPIITSTFVSNKQWLSSHIIFNSWDTLPLLGNISFKQHNRAIFKPQGHEIQVLMYSKCRHLQNKYRTQITMSQKQMLLFIRRKKEKKPHSTTLTSSITTELYNYRNWMLSVPIKKWFIHSSAYSLPP